MEVGLFGTARFDDTTGMSSPPPVTAEPIAALPPEVQAILRAIIGHYEQRIAALEAELAALKKTPENSSPPLPRSIHTLNRRATKQSPNGNGVDSRHT